MSEIIDTQFGRWRRVRDGTQKRLLWECPKCQSWGGMSDDQMAGKVSVVCSGPGGHGGCDYHETHEFGKVLVATMQASILMDEQPHHEDVPI